MSCPCPLLMTIFFRFLKLFSLNSTKKLLKPSKIIFSKHFCHSLAVPWTLSSCSALPYWQCPWSGQPHHLHTLAGPEGDDFFPWLTHTDLANPTQTWPCRANTPPAHIHFVVHHQIPYSFLLHCCLASWSLFFALVALCLSTALCCFLPQCHLGLRPPHQSPNSGHHPASSPPSAWYHLQGFLIPVTMSKIYGKYKYTWKPTKPFDEFYW